MANLTTQNYKGTRDFYPEDMWLQRHLFDAWRRVSEKFGYEEIGAPLIESTDLYRAKSGEEIVSEQTYSFTDRGGRDVTIRPEMTPSVARMVAAKQQELNLPLRWFSIANMMRYERPQHGRLREHWQLNADIFGLDDMSAELEIISLGSSIMTELGADEDMFVIKLNSRKLMSFILGEYLSLQVDAAHRMGKLLDRKNKMSDEAFINQSDAILGKNLDRFLDLIRSTRLSDFPGEIRDSAPAQELAVLAKALHQNGIGNIHFDLSVQRGLDYYTGTVFEIYDTDSQNPRSIFGGGRYDDLLQIFKAPKVPAVGFGMGDVTMADFLSTHNLLPDFTSTTKVVLASIEAEQAEYTQQLASQFRSLGINTRADVTDRKIGSKLKAADKSKVPFVIAVGKDEAKTQQYALKELATGDEFVGTLEEISGRLR